MDSIHFERNTCPESGETFLKSRYAAIPAFIYNHPITLQECFMYHDFRHVAHPHHFVLPSRLLL